MYKGKKSTVAIASFLFILLGCAKEAMDSELPQPEPIVLAVEELDSSTTKSIGPVDEWNLTQVSVAYLFEPSTVFDKSMTVIVRFPKSDEFIKTGMVYPDDDSQASFIGYHPEAKPSEVGTVNYDLSDANLDVMMTDIVSGSKTDRIIDNDRKLKFEHLLTRVTFKLECALGHNFPEAVYGLRATGNSPLTPLNTALSIELATRKLTFKMPGEVFCGDMYGFIVPPNGATPVIIDMMLQPEIPLQFYVLSLTGAKNISVSGSDDSKGIWNDLLTKGGDMGVQYTVVLRFSGQVILVNDVNITPWKQGNQFLGSESGSGDLKWW